MLLQLVQLVLQGMLLLQGLELLRAVRLRLWERVRRDWLGLRERVWLLLWNLRWLLKLHDLLGWQVQDGVLRRLLGQLWFRRHFHLAEEHCIGVRVALLAVIHLLLNMFCRC